MQFTTTRPPPPPFALGLTGFDASVGGVRDGGDEGDGGTSHPNSRLWLPAATGPHWYSEAVGAGTGGPTGGWNSIIPDPRPRSGPSRQSWGGARTLCGPLAPELPMGDTRWALTLAPDRPLLAPTGP